MTESLDDILLADPTFWRRPDKYDILARFRRERPVSRQMMPDGEGFFWSLTRHKETREITREAAKAARDAAREARKEAQQNNGCNGVGNPNC